MRWLSLLFGFLLATSPLSAQTADRPLDFINNNGGLNTAASPLMVQPFQSPNLQNVDLTQFGSIVKRDGYDQLNTSAFNSGATWTGLYDYAQKDGTRFLVGTCGDKFAKMDSLDGNDRDWETNWVRSTF